MKKRITYESFVPDSRRREVVLNMFDLNPITCETKYETLIALQGDSFVKYIKKVKQASKNLTFDVLNEQGLH